MYSQSRLVKQAAEVQSHTVSLACSVLKGDKPAAGADSIEDTPLNYGWAPFNGENGQVRWPQPW